MVEMTVGLLVLQWEYQMAGHWVDPMVVPKVGHSDIQLGFL